MTPKKKFAALTLGVLVLIAGLYFVGRPLVLRAWDSATYSEPKSDFDPSAPTPKRFTPTRIVEFDALVGKSVKFAYSALGYPSGDNLYKSGPELVQTEGMRPADLSIDHGDLTVTAVCQTMSADRLTQSPFPTVRDSDRVYFSVVESKSLTKEQMAMLTNPRNAEQRSERTALSMYLQQQVECPSGMNTIAVR